MYGSANNFMSVVVLVSQEQAEEIAREELIRNHFSARIAELNSQVCVCGLTWQNLLWLPDTDLSSPLSPSASGGRLQGNLLLLSGKLVRSMHKL